MNLTACDMAWVHLFHFVRTDINNKKEQIALYYDSVIEKLQRAISIVEEQRGRDLAELANKYQLASGFVKVVD